MTTFEESLSDEEVEEIEDAQTEAKREKTKYGPHIEENDE